MSKKININYNRIFVPSYGKLTCRTIPDSNSDDYNWKLGDLSITGKYFEVYYSQEHPDYDIILKPSKMYFDRNFEIIFGFGFNCSFYDKNKIVTIF